MVILAVFMIIADRHIPMIPHPPEKNIPAAGKAPGIALRAVMPLSDTAGAIAFVFERLPQRCMLRRNILSLIFNMEQSSPGKKHCPAGHTYRAVGSSHDVGVGKGTALMHKPIQIRRKDLLISQRVNGTMPLIVRQQKQNIRFLHIFPSL